MELNAAGYVAVFAATLSLTLGLTPLALRFAARRGVLDHPSEIKAQDSPVPYLGGIAIVTAFALVVLVAALISERKPLEELAIVIGLALLLAVLGLIDDLRGLSALLRLAIEIGAAVTVWATSTGAALFGNDAVDLVITVVWIVGVTNSFNLLDNMDGLSAGVASIAATSIFLLAVDNGQFLVATLAIALAGCAAGFLRSNFHPARIYMGDAGALFLGFMLAVLGLKLEFQGPRIITFFVPILVLGVALFDTTLVVVNRLLNQRSPMLGGRDHASHRLVFVGLPVRAAVGLIYIGAASLGCLAIVMSRVDRSTGLLLMGWVSSVALFMGVMLSLVPVYGATDRRYVMLREVRLHEGEPPASLGSPEVEAS